MHPHPLRITAGQKSGTRRGAERSGHGEVGKLATLLGHAINVGRFDFF